MIPNYGISPKDGRVVEGTLFCKTIVRSLYWSGVSGKAIDFGRYFDGIDCDWSEGQWKAIDFWGHILMD